MKVWCKLWTGVSRLKQRNMSDIQPDSDNAPLRFLLRSWHILSLHGEKNMIILFLLTFSGYAGIQKWIAIVRQNKCSSFYLFIAQQTSAQWQHICLKGTLKKSWITVRSRGGTPIRYCKKWCDLCPSILFILMQTYQ